MRTLVATALLAAVALARAGRGERDSTSSSSRSTRSGGSDRNESHTISANTDSKETYYIMEWEPRSGRDDDAFLLSVSAKISGDIHHA